MKEYTFWKVKKRLEEAILKEAKEGGNFERFLEKYAFEEPVYSDLGIVGGAFVLGDKSTNNMLYLQNRKLHRENLLQGRSNLPFLEIPYIYKYSNIKTAPNPSQKDLLDAIFIGTQDHIRIFKHDNTLPDIYKHLPQNLSKDQFEKLLPFEKELVKDGFNAIYCTVGEVVFYLYLWRLLFRLAQKEGLKMPDSDIHKDTYDGEFELDYPFWDQIIGDEEMPEADWMTTKKNRYEKNPDYKEINRQWDIILRTIDTANFRNFSMQEEYEYLGLVTPEGDGDNINNKIATKELLSLVQYIIHIARIHLKMNTYDSQPEQSSELPEFPNNLNLPVEQLSEQQILYRLYVLERRLNSFIQLGPQSDKDYFTLAHLNEKYTFDFCLQFIAKKFLFEEILNKKSTKTPLLEAIKAVHQKARFPILPYYYEVATGKDHKPKEHIVFSIWNTFDEDNKIPLKLPHLSKEPYMESAVAFVALSIQPAWRIKRKHSFLKNEESIHWATQLSQATFIRLFRIHSFFSIYSRPLIDGLFYGELIKNELKRASTSTDINAFSHELSKIIDNIFNLSNVPFKKLFEGDDTVARAIVHLADKNNHRLRIENIKDWKIIPNPKRFEVWSNYLTMWSGRAHGTVFSIKDNASLHEIIRECERLAQDMFVGERMKRNHQSTSFKLLEEYSNNFQTKKEDLKTIPLKIIYQKEKEDIKNCLLAISPIIETQESTETRDSSIIKPNAFLRIMVAALTNIYEHTTGKPFLHIRIKENVKGASSLRFCLINPCKKVDDILIKESFGTKPVIRSCLALLDGTLENFGTPDNSNQEEYWRGKIDFQNLDYDIWLSKFSIPVKDTFEL